MNGHDLKRREFAGIADRELMVVKAVHTLIDSGVIKHFGCLHH